jgi:hypothetical protein
MSISAINVFAFSSRLQKNNLGYEIFKARDIEASRRFEDASIWDLFVM